MSMVTGIHERRHVSGNHILRTRATAAKRHGRSKCCHSHLASPSRPLVVVCGLYVPNLDRNATTCSKRDLCEFLLAQALSHCFRAFLGKPEAGLDCMLLVGVALSEAPLYAAALEILPGPSNGF